MAKRSRGAARPGQMRPSRRPQRPTGSGTAAAAPGPAALRSIAAAAQDEAAAAGNERGPAADDRGPRLRDQARVEAAGSARVRGTQPSGLLAARAAQEYGYVARDVRHIGSVGGSLFVVLVLFFVAVEVLHLIKL